jgi:hypothetical protein
MAQLWLVDNRDTYYVHAHKFPGKCYWTFTHHRYYHSIHINCFLFFLRLFECIIPVKYVVLLMAKELSISRRSLYQSEAMVWPSAAFSSRPPQRERASYIPVRKWIAVVLADKLTRGEARYCSLSACVPFCLNIRRWLPVREIPNKIRVFHSRSAFREFGWAGSVTKDCRLRTSK